MEKLIVRCAALNEKSNVLYTARGGYMVASVEMWQWMQEYEGDTLTLIYTANTYFPYTLVQVHETYQKVEGTWQKVEDK